MTTLKTEAGGGVGLGGFSRKIFEHPLPTHCAPVLQLDTVVVLVVVVAIGVGVAVAVVALA